MNRALLIPAITTAVSVGLGCGTCCNPIISTFLSTYVVSHSGGVKKGVLSFVSFFSVRWSVFCCWWLCHFFFHQGIKYIYFFGMEINILYVFDILSVANYNKVRRVRNGGSK